MSIICPGTLYRFSDFPDNGLRILLSSVGDTATLDSELISLKLISQSCVKLKTHRSTNLFKNYAAILSGGADIE